MNNNFKIKNWIDYQKMIDNEYFLSKKSPMSIKETYIYTLQHQLEEKEKVINEIKKLLKEDNISYAYENLESSYLDHETLLELLEILEEVK